MKRIHTITLVGILSIGAGPLMAASTAFNEPTPNVMPVLVQVNSHGKVISATPPTQLTPKLTRLLRQNLDEMITKPATVQGHAVDSQFIMNMALHTSSTNDGKYVVQFRYVSTSPVPPGEWYWVRTDDHHLALAQGTPRAADGRYNNQAYFRSPAPPVRSFTPTLRSPSPAAPKSPK